MFNTVSTCDMSPRRPVLAKARNPSLNPGLEVTSIRPEKNIFSETNSLFNNVGKFFRVLNNAALRELKGDNNYELATLGSKASSSSRKKKKHKSSFGKLPTDTMASIIKYTDRGPADLVTTVSALRQTSRSTRNATERAIQSDKNLMNNYKIQKRIDDFINS